MTARKPLVRIGGRNVQLPSGDTIVVSDDTKLPLAGGKMTGALDEALIKSHNLDSGVGVGGGYIVDADLTSANTIQCTGNSDLVGLGSLPSGAVRRLIFTAAPIIRNSSPKMVLLTGADIQVAAGDIAVFESLGFDAGQGIGNWKMVSYTRFNGTSLVANGASDPTKLPLTGGKMLGPIDSSNTLLAPVQATTNLSDYPSNTIQFQGTGTINVLNPVDTTKSGAIRRLVFEQGGVIVKHQGGNISMPGNVDLVTLPGDVMEIIQTRAGDSWACFSYLRKDGTAVYTTVDYANSGAFPESGVARKLYLALDTGILYRWNGAAYAAIGGTSFTEQQVRDTQMTGLSLSTRTAVAATDKLIVAIGKLQAQITGSVFRKERIVAGTVGRTSWAVPNGYTPGAVIVSLNGAVLDDTDFVATDGANITGVTSVSTDDIMNVIVLSALRAQDDALLQATVAGLGSAAGVTGKMRYCTNMAGRAGPVYSDGTNWRRFVDDSVVTT